MKILLSGITGFIGSHLSCHLIKHFPDVKIIGLSRKKELSTNQKISCKFHQIPLDQYLQNVHHEHFDLEKDAPFPSSWNKADAFFHCAAQINEKKGMEYLQKVNTEGTRYILKEVDKSQIKFFLYMSSVAAHDIRHMNLPYFWTKRVAEEEVKKSSFANILIPGVVFGAGDCVKDTRDLYKLYYQSPFPFSPTGTISITDVHDLSEIAIEMFQQNFKGGSYFVTPTHENLQKIFQCYRDLSPFKGFPLFKFPNFKFFKKLQVANENHIYQDNVPATLRKNSIRAIQNLIEESFQYRKL